MPPLKSTLSRTPGKSTFRRLIAAFIVVVSSTLFTTPTSLLAASRAMGKGTLWVFAVGVSHYRNSMIDLQYADNDAEALSDALGNRAAGIFANYKTKVLVNEQVTRQSVVNGIKTFFAQATPDDTGVIALMGHSVVSNGAFYFVPYPADLTNITTEGLPVAAFEEAVQGASNRVAQLVLIFDTCHADALDIHVRGMSGTPHQDPHARGIGLANQVAEKIPHTVILDSSQSDESSWEDASYKLPGEKKGHGAFTYALLLGLDNAPSHNGAIEVNSLFNFASDEVRDRTHNKQTPTLNSTHDTNFAIARALEPPSPADAQQSATLLRQGEAARQKGQLAQAKDALAKAAQLNPKDQVARVLSDETSADLSYRDDPGAEHDIVSAAAALLKKTAYKGPTDPWAPRPMVIAFLDFNTAGGSPEHAGLHDALVARITQALQGTKRVQVVDRRLIAAVLREQKLSMTDLSDPATRLKVGQILVSRLIATGDVASVDKDQYSVDLQMIDTETTEIKVNLSEPLNGSGKLVAVADKAANDILSHVEEDYPLKGKIAALDGEQVVLDIGANAGATVGTRMKAVVEEPIKVNGEVIATKLNPVGSLEITAVQPKASFAKVIDHSVALTTGIKVIEAAKPATSS